MSNIEIQNIFSVKGKIALVTGGSRGIGLMIAEALVRNGAKVYISSRKSHVCDAVAKELSKLGECISVPADLSNKNGTDYLGDKLEAVESRLDILVNNAGAAWGAKFEEYPESGYDKVMDLNVKSPFLLTQRCMKLLEAAGTKDHPAKIINIGSIDGLHVSSLDTFAYGPSKAAIHHLTRFLAVKLGSRHITANAIAPGPFPSNMTKEMFDHFEDQINQQCPLGRTGNSEDMAGLALYMCSGASNYLNGAVIPLDGGLHLKTADFAS